MDDKKPKKEDDEITLRELIFTIKEYFQEVLTNWKLVVLITSLLVAYMLYKTYQKPTNYPASLTFMLNEDEGGGLAGLGELAASFGFGGGSSEYNLSKIIALSKSRNIIQKVLFEKVDSDYIANHLIREYEYHEKWIEDTTGYKNFLFDHSNIDSFDLTSNSVLKELHGVIIGNPEKGKDGLLTSNIDEMTGIMSLNISTTSEKLSIEMVKSLYAHLSLFYVEKTVEKQQATYNITKEKADSLLNLLNITQDRYLRFEDKNQRMIIKRYQAEKLKLQRDIQFLSLAYGEIAKSKEMADFALQSKTPFIQSIDTPIPPLEPDKTIMTYISRIILGCFLGCFLSFIYIILRKVYKQVMNG